MAETSKDWLLLGGGICHVFGNILSTCMKEYLNCRNVLMFKVAGLV